MKLATVEYTGQGVVNNCYLIESFADVLEYVDIASELTMRDLRLSSRLPVHRWDHLYRKGSLWLFALRMAELKNVSIAQAIADHVETLTRNLSRHIETTRVIVQPSGGYCRENSGVIVLDESPYTYKCETHSIVKGSEYLVLENDPRLDDVAAKRMKGKIISTVFNLRSYSVSELREVMREYDGNSLYVATTGMDTDQMNMYLGAATDCGIEILTLEWTATPTPEAVAVMNAHGAHDIKGQ